MRTETGCLGGSRCLTLATGTSDFTASLLLTKGKAVTLFGAPRVSSRPDLLAHTELLFGRPAQDCRLPQDAVHFVEWEERIQSAVPAWLHGMGPRTTVTSDPKSSTQKQSSSVETAARSVEKSRFLTTFVPRRCPRGAWTVLVFLRRGRCTAATIRREVQNE